jgi:MipA family protein
MLVRSILATGFVLAALPLAARPKEKPQGWYFTLGAGTVYAPSYVGSDNYQLSAFPSISVKYADKFFASLQDGVGYNAINQLGWRAGSIARYDFGRNEDEDSPFKLAGKNSGDLRGLGDVDGTVEPAGSSNTALSASRPRLNFATALTGTKDLWAMQRQDTRARYLGSVHRLSFPLGHSSNSPIRTILRPISASTRDSRRVRAWPAMTRNPGWCPMALAAP